MATTGSPWDGFAAVNSGSFGSLMAATNAPGLNAKLLQRLDDAVLEATQAAPTPKRELEMSPSRDLQYEYMRQRRVDAEARRLSARRLNRSASHQRLASVDRLAAQNAQSPVRGHRWQKFYKVPDEFGGSPSPTRPSQRAQSKSRQMQQRQAAGLPSARLAADGSFDAMSAVLDNSRSTGPSPVPRRPRTPVALKSPEQLYWHQYRQQPASAHLRTKHGVSTVHQSWGPQVSSGSNQPRL